MLPTRKKGRANRPGKSVLLVGGRIAARVPARRCVNAV